MVAAMAGLGVYFRRVGLDDADKLASVIGAFVALAGLGTAAYGLVTSPKQHEPHVPASEPDSLAIGGDTGGITSTGDGAINVHMRAEASGQGRVYQAGRDQTINE
ncbi:hypothetical protein ACIBI9_61755 [Nonomuraea sp. NPDC050451]|uniref:hypothetical protein n=1 Tax=Nonomuraea sp. NPDC050451 TaxID=3364364 RepID=UPI00378B97F5